MNILIVSLFPLELNTSVAISNINITKGILALGHKVTWVMPNREKCETEFNFSQVRVIRIPGYDLSRNVGFIRGKLRSHFDMLDFTRSYLREVRNVQIPNEYFDVVISTSDPKTSHVFTAKLLRSVQYGRWIQHWGDPLLGDITRNFWWPKWCIKLYEYSILRKADKVVYVTPFTCQVQRCEYPRIAYKFSFIPLPADMYQTHTENNPDCLRIAYLGDYNPAFRNLKPLYEACEKLDFAQLTIAGHGPKYQQKSNITILPRIPQDQALEIENNADVIFCACNLRGTQIPGKILYKTSSDKHILIAVDGDYRTEMIQYFESYNRFVICENTPETIATALSLLRSRAHNYKTPEQLLPINIAKEILS